MLTATVKQTQIHWNRMVANRLISDSSFAATILSSVPCSLVMVHSQTLHASTRCEKLGRIVIEAGRCWPLKYLKGQPHWVTINVDRRRSQPRVCTTLCPVTRYTQSIVFKSRFCHVVHAPPEPSRVFTSRCRVVIHHVPLGPSPIH